MANLNNIAAGLVLLSMALPTTLYSQDTAAEETPDTPELALGEEVQTEPSVGTTYTRETYGDWEMRCVLTVDGKDPCQLYQLMKDANDNSVAEISLFELPPGQAAVAGATIAAPLQTLLTEQLTVTIDDGNAKRYPFSYCAQQGCFARIGLTFEDLANFKKGSGAKVIIVHVAAPTQKLGLNLSLNGFTSGYAAVQASNLANKPE